MSELKCTKLLQMTSLQLFAAELGYIYNGRYFQSRPERIALFGSGKNRTNKVKFSRMVGLHNGKLYDHRHTRYGSSDDYIAIGNRALRLHEYLSAEKSKLVETVKLQQRRSGEVIVQCHKIRLVDF